MKRGAKVVLVCGGIVVLGGGIAWMMVQPKFRTLPRAEVERLISPQVLQWKEPTPEEKANFDRLAATFKPFKAQEHEVGSLAEIKSRGAELRALEQALAGERIGSTWSLTDPPFEEYASLKKVVKLLALASNGYVNDGNRQEALRCMTLGYRLLGKMREAESSLIAYLVNMACESILHASMVRLAKGNLDFESLETLKRLVPTATNVDPDLIHSFRGEFHYGPLAWLPDPKVELKGTGGIAALVSFDEEPPQDEWYGNYDPESTAKMASDYYGELIENASNPISKQSSAAFDRMDRDFGALPKEPERPDEEDFRSRAAWTWYKIQMNVTPNSFGRYMLGGTAFSQTMEASFKQRTAREIVRALLAAKQYRLRHGKDPSSMKELVSSGLLEREPHDFFAEAPLEIGNGKIWSVNKDRTDDGGTFKRPLNPMDVDFGVSL